VEFSQGLNVITGKSSTGKSAIIEIFDYCFGSSDYTVPEGIITARAEIYFTVLKFPAIALVLARRGESDSCFIKQLTNLEDAENLKSTDAKFFSKNYFMPLADFKKELGRYFNVTLTDIDEEITHRGYSGKRNSTPSVRSFTSFMLQHQNLIANKHAIFFRFDEKLKREQVIDHFKVFFGIADQEYFMLAQTLNDKKQELRKIEMALPKKAEEKTRAQDQILNALNEYSAISGTPLVQLPAANIVSNPQRALDLISNTPVQVNVLSSAFEQQRTKLEQRRSEVLARLRGLERRKSAATASVNFAENFSHSIGAIAVPATAEVALSVCPFCESNTDHAEVEANRLIEAISWLNNELRLSPYMRESFVEDERRFSAEIGVVRQELTTIQGLLDELDKQIVGVMKNAGVIGEDAASPRITSRAELIEKLGAATPRLMCALIHKFDTTDLKGEPPKVVGRVYVFVDECHRTQGGDMNKQMKRWLEAAIFIGFTGTPLLRKDKQTTREVFGTYIHTYKFDEAVADKVVLDLKYESRDVPQRLTSTKAIDSWFNQKTKGLNNFQRSVLRKRWATMEELMSAGERKQRIIADIIHDFGVQPRLNNDRGTAILVAASIYDACHYFRLLQNTSFGKYCGIITSYEPNHNAISREPKDSDERYKFDTYTQHVLQKDQTTKDYEDNTKQRFIDEPANLKLLI
ncbi:MAG: hypothetical protein EBY29_12975, partial [Planctomycetes bacterium]|nr:hypothetical protein [Planctomycetota bacterium]